MCQKHHGARTLSSYNSIVFATARLRGAAVSRCAADDILVFLDAHVEANTNWLLPLVATIKRDHTTIAVPHIDTININTMKYSPWNPEHHGTFTWDLLYDWKIDPYETSHNIDRFPTVAMIGCAFAVQYDYFYHIGSFDNQVSNCKINHPDECQTTQSVYGHSCNMISSKQSTL